MRFHRLKEEFAVEAISVDPRGPAGQAGLLEGDLIVGIQEQDVASVDDLHRFLAEMAGGPARHPHGPPGPGAPNAHRGARGSQRPHGAPPPGVRLAGE